MRLARIKICRCLESESVWVESTVPLHDGMEVAGLHRSKAWLTHILHPTWPGLLGACVAFINIHCSPELLCNPLHFSLLCSICYLIRYVMCLAYGCVCHFQFGVNDTIGQRGHWKEAGYHRCIFLAFRVAFVVRMTANMHVTLNIHGLKKIVSLKWVWSNALSICTVLLPYY